MTDNNKGYRVECIVGDLESLKNLFGVYALHPFNGHLTIRANELTCGHVSAILLVQGQVLKRQSTHLREPLRTTSHRSSVPIQVQ